MGAREQLGTEVIPLHIVPTFGREHECSCDCWCQPHVENIAELINGDHDRPVYVHHVAH